MSFNEEKLNELAEKLGIYLSFTDYGTQKTYQADRKSKQVICAGLGYPAHSDKAVEKSLIKLENQFWLNGIEATHTAYKEEIKPLVFEMALPKKFEHNCIHFEFHKEDNTVDKGSFWFHDMPFLADKEIDGICYQKRRVYLFLNADEGYHQMHFILPDEKVMKMHLFVVPSACYQPPETPENKYVYGFPVQLYALKSRKNFGIGDFGDLRDLADIAQKLHASLIGINPLSALFEDMPQDASPYSASSRLFLNPLYIDIENVAKLQSHAVLQKKINTKAFQRKLQTLRDTKEVNYQEVAEIKYSLLNQLYRHFMATKPAKRYSAFQKFCKEQGEELENFAVFQAIRSVFGKENKSLYWRSWEKEFQNPLSSTIAHFKTKYADLINAIKYRQFLAFEQYDKVVKQIKQQLPIGLYTDMPVGVCENSAEVWAHQNLFIEGVSAGAPPDAFNRKGQDWGLAAFHPLALKQTGFSAYRKVIRQMMHGAGAVRIDHAFGLERLYLRVKNAGGAYLTYPFKTLMGIIALESMRAKCLVIAEDLGTAPCGFSDKMAAASAYSFKILHFHRQGDSFQAPSCFPYCSLIASGTHDMPSYSAFYKGLDLALSKRLKTMTTAQYNLHRKERLSDKSAFVTTFQRAGYPMPDEPIKIAVNADETPPWFIENTYRYLNDCESRLLMVRLEDVFYQDEQTNVPGTCFEYPNWRYKLPVLTEDFLKNESLKKIIEIIKEKRGYSDE